MNKKNREDSLWAKCAYGFADIYGGGAFVIISTFFTVFMSRRAKLYLLDEPIGGVDPATRDFILHTIVANTDEDSSVLISTHLISDVEPILDEAVFINNGRIVLKSTVDAIREEHGKSVNDYFREVFKCY